VTDDDPYEEVTAKSITQSNARAQYGLASDASEQGDFMKAALHEAHGDRMVREAREL
jgi:hypothetical protein